MGIQDQAIETTETLEPSPSPITLSPTPTPPLPGGNSQGFTNLIASGKFLRISLILLVVLLWGILVLGVYLYWTNKERD